MSAMEVETCRNCNHDLDDRYQGWGHCFRCGLCEHFGFAAIAKATGEEGT